MTDRLSLRRMARDRDTRPASALVWLVRRLARLAGVWGMAFLHSVHALPDPPPDPVPHADGIVTLTGGGERIVAAMTLLRDNKGARLLISGVHPDTTRDDLKKLID